MLHILTRLFGATRTGVRAATTGFPVMPVLGPVARPGLDVAGPALILGFESEGWIGYLTFRDGSVVLPVYDRYGWAGVYAVDQTVFARMLELRGGIDGVLGAAVRVRDTGNGLELMFHAAPVGSADRRAHASRAPWPRPAGRSRHREQRVA